MQRYPHRIRLRGPWECEPVARAVRDVQGAASQETESLPPAGRVHVPGDWSEALGPGFRGRVRFRRRFHRPTGLEPHERIMLVIEGVDREGIVQLNGQRLGRVKGMTAQATFDVTAMVEARNELVVEVEYTDPVAGQTGGQQANTPSSDGGRVGEVRLEIVAET